MYKGIPTEFADACMQATMDYIVPTCRSVLHARGHCPAPEASASATSSTASKSTSA